MGEQPKSAAAIWHQKIIPVVYRPGGGLPLLVRLPYAENNYEWLRGDNRRKPKWLATFKCWEVPNTWLNDLVRELVLQYERVYLIQPHNAIEKCAPACWNATGFECQCSCMGQNHGSQSGEGWYVVSQNIRHALEGTGLGVPSDSKIVGFDSKAPVCSIRALIWLFVAQQFCERLPRPF